MARVFSVISISIKPCWAHGIIVNNYLRNKGMNGLGVPRLLQTLGESPAFVQLDDRAKSGREATLYLAGWATEAQKSRRPRAVGRVYLEP